MSSPPNPSSSGDRATRDPVDQPSPPDGGHGKVRERFAGMARGASARAEPIKRRTQDRIAREDESTRTGVAIGWFARYREADGQLYSLLLAAYLFVTIIPATLAIATYVGSDPNAVASRTIARLSLTGATAGLVRQVLTGAGNHQLTATLIAVASVIVFGLGIARSLQLIYGRVWHIPARGSVVTDNLRYLGWLLVFLAGTLLYVIESALLRTASNWVEWALAPLWAIGAVAFLTWTPVLLLHGRIGWRDALPGALLGAVAIVGLRALSALVLTDWLNWYSKYYGGLGIVLAIFFWLALATTILIIAAALSPAYAARRQARSLAAGGPSTPAPHAEGQPEA